VPPHASILKRVGQRILRAVRHPARAAYGVGRLVAAPFAVPRLMPYRRAFDAVMSSAEISVPIMSTFAINHRDLAQQRGVFASSASIKRHYRAWSGYDASYNIINHYYYQNILRGFIDAGQVRTILEIGAGNGNFSSILYHDWAPVRIVLIDLPETLAVSIPFLSSLFGRAKVVMPNEIRNGRLPDEFDFAFLTVDQLETLADDSVDLAINCDSFQEMTHQQIHVYIELVQRVCWRLGFFFAANRVEKIPCGRDAFTVRQPDPPNRMADYPWNRCNEVLVNEVSKLSRLVQLDGVSIRLERICKS
jgi:putative sugar O-methyltransferase